MELLRDPIRLAFAFVGPLILMVAFGYGITFDVENLKYAAFDQDNTPASHRLLENFSGSHYFSERPPIRSPEELEHRMRSGELALVVEIPPDFGRDLSSLHSPEVGFWIDAAMPFRGETTQGYVTGSMLHYMQDLATERFGPNPVSNVYLGNLNIENRFRYNQGFKSVFSMVPSVIVIMLVLIPAIMATIGVVREKETGSISNFQSTPISKSEFLLGKQFPYVVVGMVMFIIMVIEALVLFQVPVKGSFIALATRSFALRFLHVQFRTSRLDIHQDPGSGGLRHHGHRHYSYGELFGPARACVLSHRPRKADRPDVSGGLVPADQRRYLYQRTGLF